MWWLDMKCDVIRYVLWLICNYINLIIKLVVNWLFWLIWIYGWNIYMEIYFDIDVILFEFEWCKFIDLNNCDYLHQYCVYIGIVCNMNNICW